MDEEARKLEAWLQKDVYGEMEYMARHFDLRTDPTLLVPGAKSIISLAYNYYTDQEQRDPFAPKISKYVYGKDYHKVIKKKLKNFIEEIRLQIGEVHGRCFVDSAPVMERDWAVRSGLGWMGKNTLLIHPKKGSYFFLAEIICDLELQYDHPIQDYCGTCRRCIDACPTDAFSQEGYFLYADRCISYLTIEHRSALPEEFKGKMADYIFGCDICQQVCPWNRFSTPHREESFRPREDMLKMNRKEWIEMTEKVFDTMFEGSAVKRAKYSGLKRNISFLSENGNESSSPK